MENIHKTVEIAALAVEVLAVSVIVAAILFGSLRFVAKSVKQPSADAYVGYKRLLGKSLLLSLEFLVAADVIRTVALQPSLQNVGTLGALVGIRTFLNWSITVEMEGRLPWRTGGGGERTQSASSGSL